MDRTAQETLDFKASDVKACRICLAIDIKLYTLQDTYLGSCMKSIGGFNIFCVNLPNYVCYECAPTLIKCHKLIEKSKTAQTTLLDIFNKNGQINKPLIEEQSKSNPNLQSSLDCYLLQSYFHIKYDDESSTSNFMETESDPNVNNNIKLELKKEIKEELLEDMSSTEVLNMFKNLKEEENASESDVEEVEVPRAVVEISSDDEKMGDDFVSLKSYDVRVNHDAVEGLLAYVDDVPRYHKQNPGQGIGIPKRGKRTKFKRFGSTEPYNGDSFVRRYCNINRMPTRTNKKYSCKNCPEGFNYLQDARDHIVIGCQRSSTRPSASAVIPRLESNIAGSNQPNHWKEWPGGSK